MPFLPAFSSLLLVGAFAAFVSDLGNRAAWEFAKSVVGLGEKQRRRVLVWKRSPLPHMPPIHGMSVCHREICRDRFNILNITNQRQAFGRWSQLEIEANHFRDFGLARSMDSQHKDRRSANPSPNQSKHSRLDFQEGGTEVSRRTLVPFNVMCKEQGAAPRQLVLGRLRVPARM